jgi:hypothetical protein
MLMAWGGFSAFVLAMPAIEAVSCSFHPPSHIRGFSEIPTLVVHPDPPDFIGRERNVLVSPNGNDASFACHSLVEMSSIFQLNRNDLIANTCLFISHEMVGILEGNGH